MSSDKLGDKEDQGTGKLNRKQRQASTIPRLVEYGSRYTKEDIEFRPVPQNLTPHEDEKSWFVLFKFAEPAPRVTIGLQVLADVTIGRGGVDIDTTSLNGQALGVSRRHAILRPTGRNLFIIDKGSTNGTYVNAMPLGQGRAQTINTGDLVTLAGLIFEVEVIARPGEPLPEVIYDNPYVSSFDNSRAAPLTRILAGFSSDDNEPPTKVPGTGVLPPDVAKEVEVPEDEPSSEGTKAMRRPLSRRRSPRSDDTPGEDTRRKKKNAR